MECPFFIIYADEGGGVKVPCQDCSQTKKEIGMEVQAAAHLSADSEFVCQLVGGVGLLFIFQCVVVGKLEVVQADTSIGLDHIVIFRSLESGADYVAACCGGIRFRIIKIFILPGGQQACVKKQSYIPVFFKPVEGQADSFGFRMKRVFVRVGCL